MEMVICTRFINLSSFTTLSAFTEEKRGGLDRWELLSHWVARVGDTGSRRLKQTFFTNAAERPSIGGAATQPCVRHLRCGRGSGEEAVTEKGGREEKRGTNYSSHELRLRGQEREREIHDDRPQWRRRRISSLSTEREKERLGRSSEVNERACRRAMQLWNTKEPRDEATRGQHATFPMHQRVRPLLQIRLPHLIPKTKSESAEGGNDPSSSGLLCLLHLQPAFPTFPLPVPVSPGIRPFQMMRYLWGNHFPVVTPFISASLSPTCPSSYVTWCSSHFALSFVSSFFPGRKSLHVLGGGEDSPTVFSDSAETSSPFSHLSLPPLCAKQSMTLFSASAL